MRTYIVAYDIADPKRLRRVHKTVKQYGKSLQFSVFLCELSQNRRMQLEIALSEIIKGGEDQVLFIDLGPSSGRGSDCIEAIGQALEAPEDGPLIVI